MIVVYTPEGGEPEHYDASSLRVSEAAIVQRTVDMKWAEIKEGLERDDLDAMRGIIWVIKKRSQPALRFGDFDPGVDEMTTRMDQKEVEAYVDRYFAASETEPDVDREKVADILMRQLPDIAADPEHARMVIEKAAVPKADEPETGSGQLTEMETGSSQSPTSSTPETPTSDSSPTSFTSLPEMSTT